MMPGAIAEEIDYTMSNTNIMGNIDNVGNLRRLNKQRGEVVHHRNHARKGATPDTANLIGMGTYTTWAS